MAEAAYSEKTGKPQRQRWLQTRCHRLKHELDGAENLLTEKKALTW